MQPSTIEPAIRRDLRYNFIINLLDGGFFGLALGFGSFVTVIPLFVSHLTDSALLIGLVPAVHNVGWQLPQLFTAGWVSRLRRYKPMVLWLTIHERLPFFGLALLAWLLPGLDKRTALGLTFALLIWQGFGGGFTANAWTSMIAKIMPSELRGTFFGMQSAVANGLSAVSAVLAGFLLERLPSPLDFALCFLLTGIGMGISFGFISMTREPASPEPEKKTETGGHWRAAVVIWRENRNFRRFLIVRMLSHFAMMGSSFYIVHLSRNFAVSEAQAGLLTGTYMGALIVANPLLGFLGDRWGHRRLMIAGLLASALSATLAWFAPSAGWFYLVFILAAPAVAAVWTVALTMTTHFSGESERPIYIGLSNTLPAPAAILAPILGGWLADLAGYQATFLATAAAGLLTAALLFFFVREPQP